MIGPKVLVSLVDRTEEDEAKVITVVDESDIGTDSDMEEEPRDKADGSELAPTTARRSKTNNSF